MLYLTKNINIKFHTDTVVCMDINDKYLVSGSWDGSCMILPATPSQTPGTWAPVQQTGHGR